MYVFWSFLSSKSLQLMIIVNIMLILIYDDYSLLMMMTWMMIYLSTFGCSLLEVHQKRSWLLLVRRTSIDMTLIVMRIINDSWWWEASLNVQCSHLPMSIVSQLFPPHLLKWLSWLWQNYNILSKFLCFRNMCAANMALR